MNKTLIISILLATILFKFTANNIYAATKVCWHKTYEVPYCPGNDNAAYVQDLTCTNECNQLKTEVLNNNLPAKPSYILTPIDNPINPNDTVSKLLDNAQWQYYSTTVDDLPVGWYLEIDGQRNNIYSLPTDYINDYDSGNINQEYPDFGDRTATEDNVDDYPSESAHENAISGAYNDMDSLDKIDVRNCVTHCGNILEPIYSTNGSIYESSIFPNYYINTPEFLPNPTPGGIPIDNMPSAVSYPSNTQYAECWNQCTATKKCEELCDNSADIEQCEANCDILYTTKRNSANPTLADLAAVNCSHSDYCPASQIRVGGECQTYWRPKQKIEVKVGETSCGSTAIRKKRKETITLDPAWNPEFRRFQAKSSSSTARVYVAGVDVDNPGDGPAFCLYNINSFDTNLISTLDPYAKFQAHDEDHSGGRQRNPTPRAYGTNIAYQDVDPNHNEDLCYKLPLIEGPPPCCTTLILPLALPIIVDIKKEAEEPALPEPTYYSTFTEPAIRVLFTNEDNSYVEDTDYVDLHYNFVTNPEDGVTECKDLMHDAELRTFCVYIDEEIQEVCAYEKRTRSGAEHLYQIGCNKRSMIMPNNLRADGIGMEPGRGLSHYYNLNSAGSHFLDIKMHFGMTGFQGKHGRPEGSANFSTVNAEEVRFFRYTFRANTFTRQTPVQNNSLVYCLSNMKIEREDLINKVQYFGVHYDTSLNPPAYNFSHSNTADLNGGDTVYGLCVDVPPTPCGYPEQYVIKDPDAGYASWNYYDSAMSTNETEKIIYALEDPSYSSESYGVRYCPPGYAHYNEFYQSYEEVSSISYLQNTDFTSIRASRRCIKNADGLLEWDLSYGDDENGIMKPCVRRQCPEQLACAAAENMGTANPACNFVGKTGSATYWQAEDASELITSDPANTLNTPYYASTYTGDNHENGFSSRICVDVNYRESYGGAPQRRCDHLGRWEDIDSLTDPCVERICEPISIGNSSFSSGSTGINYGSCKATADGTGQYVAVDGTPMASQGSYNIGGTDTAPSMSCIPSVDSIHGREWNFGTHANDCVYACHDATFELDGGITASFSAMRVNDSSDTGTAGQRAIACTGGLTGADRVLTSQCYAGLGFDYPVTNCICSIQGGNGNQYTNIPGETFEELSTVNPSMSCSDGYQPYDRYDCLEDGTWGPVVTQCDYYEPPGAEWKLHRNRSPNENEGLYCIGDTIYELLNDSQTGNSTSVDCNRLTLSDYPGWINHVNNNASSYAFKINTPDTKIKMCNGVYLTGSCFTDTRGIVGTWIYFDTFPAGHNDEITSVKVCYDTEDPEVPASDRCNTY